MSFEMTGGPLVRRFIAFSLAIALPIWVISLVLLATTVQEVRVFTRVELQRQAQLASLRVDAWFLDQAGDLKTLSLLPPITHGARQEALRLLCDVAAARPSWYGLGIVDTQGRLVVSSLYPSGTLLPSPESLSAARLTIQDGKPHVSGIFTTRAGHGRAVAIHVPLRRGGRIVGSLGTVYRLEALKGLFRGLEGRVRLPGETSPLSQVIDVFDRQGRIVFHSQDPGHRSGPAPAGLVPSPSGAPVAARVFERTDPDGVHRLYADQVAPATGWRVVVGIPESLLTRVRTRLLAGAGIMDALATLLTLALALVIAGLFTRPIRQLRTVALAFSEGHLAARVPPGGRDEIGDLGRAFNLMAERLAESQRHMEDQVRSRTAALEAANRDLEASGAQAALTNLQLSATIDELRRMDQQRAEFLNMVSHDLRIPLTTIVGYAELLEELSLVGTASEYTRQILLASDRMSRLLEQLLDFARVEAGQLKLDRKWVNLAELLPESAAPFQILADRKGVTMEVALAPDLPLVNLDETRTLQVISNLLSNAIKFTPAGGRVEVCARPEADGVRIEIQDSGIGIPASDLPNLFKRFFRARNATEPGTGLGLAIAKGIVTAHGGRIGVESAEGKGSTFWFWLPAGGSVDQVSRPEAKGGL